MSYRFHVHRTQPAFRLVTARDADFPSQTRIEDWRFTVERDRADTNPDVARLVDQTGYCLFKIGMSFDEISEGKIES